jgi:hypothetical protein
MKNISILFYLTCLFTPCCNSSTIEIKSEFILPNGANISIVENVFDATKHRIEKCRGNSIDICYIDGREPFGVLSEIPRTFLKNITVNYQGEVYRLDSSNMYNAWGDRLKHALYPYYFWGDCKDKYNCTFRGLFADAAAAFNVEWKIINGKSTRTVLCHSMDFCFESLKPMSNLYKNKPIKLNPQRIDSITKLNLANGINVVITKKIFDKSRFKMEKCKHVNAICLINGYVPFGTSRTSYEIPKTYVKNITVKYKDIDYNLDVSDMYDMDIVKFGGTCNEELKFCAFRGVFSNKNGNFAAQWRLDVNNQWSGSRISALSSSQDIIECFLKYIDADIFYN